VTKLRTPQDALAELQRSLGAELVNGDLSSDILPATLEVDFIEGSTKEDQLAMRARMLQLPEVDEIEAVIEGHGLLARLYALREWIGVWRWVIGVWVGLSVVFVLNQFVRLNLHQRRREVEVLESVGASRAFILSPLVIEGSFQAALGSLSALWLVERLFSSQESGTEMMSQLLQFTPQPLSWGLSVSFVCGSMILGATASWRAANSFLSRDIS
jgi:cell division transport system permease protein